MLCKVTHYASINYTLTAIKILLQVESNYDLHEGYYVLTKGMRQRLFATFIQFMIISNKLLVDALTCIDPTVVAIPTNGTWTGSFLQ